MREIWESIKEALIRWFDSIAVRNSERSDELIWLRSQLALAHRRIEELTSQLTTQPTAVDVEPIVSTQPQPINTRVPWAVRKHQLEKQDRQTFARMKEERKVQSIDELEQELLGDTNAS